MVDSSTGRREFHERSEVKSGTGRREGRESSAGQPQLQQAQRQENLGKLAVGVAHDFSNLLAVILSFASFASAELALPSGPDWPERLESARRDLEQVILAAERAASLTRQLLASVHQEAADPQALDLDHDVTSDVQEILRRTLGEHVGLATTLGVDLWPVLADPGQQTLLGSITAGGGYVSEQTSADLASAVRTVTPGQPNLDQYASRQVITRLRDRMAGDPVAALTGQERRVLELIGEGLTNRQIAERMALAEKTAKNYVSSLLAKLGMHRRTEAAAFAAVRHAPDQDDRTLTGCACTPAPG
jgi:DNA-binding CsgD family transcriptional regulator